MKKYCLMAFVNIAILIVAIFVIEEYIRPILYITHYPICHKNIGIFEAGVEAYIVKCKRPPHSLSDLVNTNIIPDSGTFYQCPFDKRHEGSPSVNNSSYVLVYYYGDNGKMYPFIAHRNVYYEYGKDTIELEQEQRRFDDLLADSIPADSPN